MPTISGKPVPLSDRGWPVRGVTIGAATPAGPTAYPDDTAGRAADGTPGKGALGAPAGAILPRTAETTGVPPDTGADGMLAPPTELGVLPIEAV